MHPEILRLCRCFASALPVVMLVTHASAQPAPPPPPPPDSAPPSTVPAEPPSTPPPATAAPASPPTPTPAPAPSYAPPVYTPPAYAAPYAPTTAAETKPKRDPRVADANADRVVILPTAYTHPEGTFYMSSYEIVLLQIGYAVSDSTQISLTGVPPITTEQQPDAVFLFDLSLKNAFLRDGPFRMAAIGSVAGILGLDEGNAVIGRAGVTAQLCFEPDCESSATMGASMLLGGPATFMVTGAGFIWRIANWAALLLEVDTFVPLGGEIGEFSGVAVLPAFRFPYRTWALDLGFARGLDTEEPPDPAVIPFIAFTYRFLP